MQIFSRKELVEAKRYLYLFLVDATDGITPETGEAGGQPQISITGAVFVNTVDTLHSIGNGAYFLILSAAELDFLGSFIVRYKSANTAEFQALGQTCELFITKGWQQWRGF